MPDKAFGSLDLFDQKLRKAIPCTDSTGIQLRIEKVVGFELFNTRSYHNYETWSDGYHLIGPIDSRGWIPWIAFRETAEKYGIAEDVARDLYSKATGFRAGLLEVEREDLDDGIDEWIARRDRVRRALELCPVEQMTDKQRTELAVLGYHLPPYPPKEES